MLMFRVGIISTAAPAARLRARSATATGCGARSSAAFRSRTRTAASADVSGAASISAKACATAIRLIAGDLPGLNIAESIVAARPLAIRAGFRSKAR